MMIIPQENAQDIPQDHLGLDIHPVTTVEEAMALLFDEPKQVSA
jgi:ATP-dependent Lon protease